MGRIRIHEVPESAMKLYRSVFRRAAMTGHLVSSEAPSGRWRYENGPNQDSRSAGIGDEAVPVRVQAEGCRMKIGPNRKSRIKLFRNPLTALALLYAVV